MAYKGKKNRNIIALVIFFGVLMVVGQYLDPPVTESSEDRFHESKTESRNLPNEKQKDTAKYIPDIEPVDVYLNLEDIGFTTEKDLGSEWGNFWTSTLKSGAIEFRVEISSKDVNKVQSIDATVMNQNFNESEARQFLKYVASSLSLYGKNYESEINNWIDENYNKDKTERYIDGVYLRLMAPSAVVRSLLIDSNPNDGI